MILLSLIILCYVCNIIYMLYFFIKLLFFDCLAVISKVLSKIYIKNKYTILYI